MNTKLAGAMGEAYTAEYFRKKKYEVIAMNYRTKFGEIDLIAADKKRLVFVEVKLRKKGGITRAADAVSASKRRKLRLAADKWLSSNEAYSSRDISFSVAELYTSEDGTKIESINIIESAF